MKIGLFFGSFNPLHIGHKSIASYMVEFTDLEKVYFVVSPQNPLKEFEITFVGHNKKQESWKYTDLKTIIQKTEKDGNKKAFIFT